MLRGMSPSCWDDYVNFLLGDKCYLMKIHGGKGNEATPLRPPSRILINFEHELRRDAVKRSHNENRPLKDTLAEVCRDSELKERFFASLIALQPRALEMGNKRSWDTKGAPWFKGKGKGWQEGVPVQDPSCKWLRKDGKGQQLKGRVEKARRPLPRVVIVLQTAPQTGARFASRSMLKAAMVLAAACTCAMSRAATGRVRCGSTSRSCRSVQRARTARLRPSDRASARSACYIYLQAGHVQATSVSACKSVQC